MTNRAMAVRTTVPATRSALFALFALFELFTPGTAHAQGDRDQGGGYIRMVQPREHERVLITTSVGFVPSIGHQFSEDAVGRLRDGRTSRATVDYDLRHAIDIEAGAIVMLNRSWGAGFTLSRSRFENVETTTTLTGAIALSQLDTGLLRKETAGRIELTRVLFRRESMQDPFDSETSRATGYIVRVFGGPAFYRAEQHVVTLRTSEIDMHEGTGWGYHAGLDVSMFTSIPGLGGGGVGFGGTVRYSGGSVRLDGLLDNGPSGRPAGGWNFAGGIRFRI